MVNFSSVPGSSLFRRSLACGFWFLRKSEVRAIILSVGGRISRFLWCGFGFQSACLAQSLPTKRVPDMWESARFRSIFLASAFSYSQTESTPAHTQVTQAVRLHVFSFRCEIEALVQLAFRVAARNRVFPAVYFFAASFFLVGFSLSVGFFFFNHLVCLSAFLAHQLS